MYPKSSAAFGVAVKYSLSLSLGIAASGTSGCACHPSSLRNQCCVAPGNVCVVLEKATQCYCTEMLILCISYCFINIMGNMPLSASLYERQQLQEDVIEENAECKRRILAESTASAHCQIVDAFF